MISCLMCLPVMLHIALLAESGRHICSIHEHGQMQNKNGDLYSPRMVAHNEYPSIRCHC